MSLRDAVGAYEKDLLQDALKTTQGQPRQGGAAARHDRADHQLQGPPVRHRRQAVQELGQEGRKGRRGRRQDGRGAGSGARGRDSRPCYTPALTARGHRHSSSIDRRPPAAPSPPRTTWRIAACAVSLFLALALEAAALPRGRGRRRQDRAGRCDGGRARHRSHSPAVLRGPGRQPRAVRVGLRAAAPRTAHARRGPRARSSERAARALQRGVSHQAAAAAGHRSAAHASGRPARSTRSIAPTRSSKGSSSSCSRSFRSRFPSSARVRAAEPPLVILTSNRTREVHDALKRRCLYQWIDYPSFEKELAIVRERVPRGAGGAGGAGDGDGAGAEIRELYKVPGVSRPSIGSPRSWRSTARPSMPRPIDDTLGVVLKAKGGSRGAARPPRRRTVRARRSFAPHHARDAGWTSHLADNLLDLRPHPAARRSAGPPRASRWISLDALGARRTSPHRDEVYHACRALLVHRKDQIAIFDAGLCGLLASARPRQPRNRRVRTRSSRSHVSVVDIEEVLASED